MRRIIASIDIGTNSIKIVVAEIVNNKVKVLAASDTPSLGMKKGLIVNSEEVISTLKKGLKKCEDILGLKITKAVVSVPSYDAQFALGEGTSTVTNPERRVGGVDIVMAINSSVYNKVFGDRELVSAIPTAFKLDNEKLVKNPKGLNTVKLSVQTIISSIPKKNVYSILNVLDKCGIKVVDIYLSGMGDYEIHKTNKTEESVGAIVNLGSETTTVSIFNKGVLTNTEVTPLGGNNIDNDFCFIYKIEKKDAKKLREKLALSHKRLADASEVETVINKLGEKIKINQYEVSEIMASRLNEILELAKKQINLLTKKEISYIIFTGGLTEAKDFPLILESVYGHNVSIGVVNELGIRDNKYSTCIGMIKCFYDFLKIKDKEFSIFNSEELEELASANKRLNLSENSMLGKVFGYFFDN